MFRADSLAFQAAVEIDHSDGGIRPARLDDLPALLELEQLFPTDRLSRRSLRRLILGADVLVHEQDGEVVANTIVLYRRNSTRARLYSLIVHPGYQGRGIAAALLRAAEQAALRRGCSVLSLEVRADNAAALRLYQKAGFSLARQIPGYYMDHSPALGFAKPLASRQGSPE